MPIPEELEMSEVPLLKGLRLLISFPLSRHVQQVVSATVCSGGGRSSLVAIGGSAIGTIGPPS